jgi:hypothetical protein
MRERRSQTASLSTDTAKPRANPELINSEIPPATRPFQMSVNRLDHRPRFVRQFTTTWHHNIVS